MIKQKHIIYLLFLIYGVSFFLPSVYVNPPNSSVEGITYFGYECIYQMLKYSLDSLQGGFLIFAEVLFLIFPNAIMLLVFASSSIMSSKVKKVIYFISIISILSWLMRSAGYFFEEQNLLDLRVGYYFWAVSLIFSIIFLCIKKNSGISDGVLDAKLDIRTQSTHHAKPQHRGSNNGTKRF